MAQRPITPDNTSDNSSDLSLPEAILLLALDPDSGWYRPIGDSAFELAMAGATLLELALLGVLDNDVQQISLFPERAERVPAALGPSFHLLAAQPTPLSIRTALAITSVGMPRLSEVCVEQLIARGVLAPAGHRFRAGAARIADWDRYRQLRQRLRRLVLEDELPNPPELALFALLAATGLLAAVFTAEESSARADRIQRLLRMELIGQAMVQALRQADPTTQADQARARLGLHPGHPSTSAGGLPAVVTALGQVYRALGPRRGALALTHINQPGGFDCSGCAWPEAQDKRTRLDFCENGAKALAADASRRTISTDFFARWSLADLALQSDYWLEQQGRLTRPMIRRDGDSHYRPATYDQAYALIAERLRALRDPTQAVFYSCGHAVNEAAFAFQLCARQFGSPHLPSSINLCHEPSGRAMTEALGFGKGDARLEDFAQADALFLVGHNPGSNHPRMLRVLEAAARRGARIVVINPLPEAGLTAFANPQHLAGLLGRASPLQTLHLPVRGGGDLALFKGLIKCLLEADAKRPGEVLDQTFIETFATGFEPFAQAIATIPWASIEAGSGLPRALIEEASLIYREADRVVLSWGLGLTQQVQGTETLREIINLMLLRGQIGRPGAGLCPMRGHSNILGIRSMGAGEQMPTAFLDALEQGTGLRVPRQPGWHAVAAIQAMQRGEAQALLSLGGNLAASAPDTDATIAALRGCQLTVQIGTTLNRTHVAAGRTAVILPCLVRSERELIGGQVQASLIEDMMGEVKPSRGVLNPIDATIRGETRIVAELATALHGSDQPIPWRQFASDYAAIRQLIGTCIPAYRQAVEWGRGQATISLPNSIRQRDFSAIGGRARFAVTALASADTANTANTNDVIRLMTIRSHDQLNTAIHGLDDRYRSIRQARRVVLMNSDDMQRLGIAPEQIVHLSRADPRTPRVEQAEQTLQAEQPAQPFHAIPYPIPQGCAAAYFPEANRLTDLRLTDRPTGTPASKAAVVRLVRKTPETGA